MPVVTSFYPFLVFIVISSLNSSMSQINGNNSPNNIAIIYNVLIGRD